MTRGELTIFSIVWTIITLIGFSWGLDWATDPNSPTYAGGVLVAGFLLMGALPISLAISSVIFDYKEP